MSCMRIKPSCLLLALLVLIPACGNPQVKPKVLWSKEFCSYLGDEQVFFQDQTNTYLDAIKSAQNLSDEQSDLLQYLTPIETSVGVLISRIKTVNFPKYALSSESRVISALSKFDLTLKNAISTMSELNTSNPTAFKNQLNSTAQSVMNSEDLVNFALKELRDPKNTDIETRRDLTAASSCKFLP
jgi:hypothetical protein